MFIESLIQLALIIDEFESSGQTLISKEFHDNTKTLIENQTKFLIEDLKFKETDPGPYTYGFGDLTLTIFSPDHTEIQEWAIIARKGVFQKNYRFNSILGLLKALSLVVNDTNDVDAKNL